MTRYAIALGSNLGDRVQHLRAALHGMGRLGEIQGISGLYETVPVGGPAQDPYLNAVVIVESPLQARGVLDRLQAVEADLGRERSVRWGPRTLDLDIIATDGDPVQTPELEIPHPRAAERRFVLDPLAEVWPEAMVGDELSAAAAKGLVADQEVELLLLDWADASAHSPGRNWVGAQLVLIFFIAVAIGIDGSLPDSGLGVIRIGGGLLLVLGISTVSLAARALGQSLTAMPEPIPGAAMVDSGVYSRARHPIYGGVILVLLGASLLLASAWAAWLSVGLFGFFWAKSTYEERMLRVAHPGYRAYRHRVRRRMIPFVV